MASHSLEDFVADELSRRSTALADHWIQQMERSDSGAVTTDALVSDLREHVPELVRCVVEFMRDPGETSRPSLVTRLRLHADRRRARGYDLQQLLTDFELLSKLVFTAFADAIKEYGGGAADPGAVAVLAGRLREALMEITSDAVGMYRQSELEQKRALAKKLSDFGRLVTHELKNPLGAAQSGTQLLQDTSVVSTANDRDRFIRLVLRNLVRMQDLIRDIRAVSLGEDAERVERWTQLDVVVAKVFDELKSQAKKKGVRLDIEGALPPASVDATRLDIALANLIGNAIKYSDPRKQDRRITVRANTRRDRRKGQCVRLEVRDNGLGIPKAMHGSVFKQHFRAHPHVAEGTGLGLAITNELVTSAGGKIWFESVEGEGTTFYVDVPEGDGRRTEQRRSAERSTSLGRLAPVRPRSRGQSVAATPKG